MTRQNEKIELGNMILTSDFNKLVKSLNKRSMKSQKGQITTKNTSFNCVRVVKHGQNIQGQWFLVGGMKN